MSISSAAKTSRNDKAAMLAEIDFMFAEMKKADERIRINQAETDALRVESREILQRTQIILDSLIAK